MYNLCSSRRAEDAYGSRVQMHDIRCSKGQVHSNTTVIHTIIRNTASHAAEESVTHNCSRAFYMTSFFARRRSEANAIHHHARGCACQLMRSRTRCKGMPSTSMSRWSERERLQKVFVSTSTAEPPLAKTQVLTIWCATLDGTNASEFLLRCQLASTCGR